MPNEWKYWVRLVVIATAIFLLSCRPALEAPELTPQYDSQLVERGYQLTNGLAACGSCHGEDGRPDSLLAGGRVITDPYGEIVAPNLTSDVRTGIGSWSANDVVSAVRESVRPDGSEFESNAHWGYEWMSDSDALAIAGYIKTIAPIVKRTERRELGIITRTTSGVFEPQAHQVAGYVPAVEHDKLVEFGHYLTDSVARCGYCHSSEASFFVDSIYLAGGRSIKRGNQTLVAPNITSNEVDGIGSWSEKQIVKFLKTGLTPDQRQVNLDFCPVQFYTRAKDDELAAIASYLKVTQVKNGAHSNLEDQIRKVGGKTNKRKKRSDDLVNR